MKGGGLDVMFLQGDERGEGKRQLDIRQLNYDYEEYDYHEAATNFNWANDYERNRKTLYNNADFIKRRNVRIYPDTLVWVRDLGNQYNSLFAEHYFSGSAYDDYPVVGIAYYQAKAYCAWRTKYLKKQLKLAGYEGYDFEFRLPTESEWEYAAIAQSHYPNTPINMKDYPTFPWDGNELKKEGAFLANFGPIKDKNGNWVKFYPESLAGNKKMPIENYLFTAPCGSFPPNENGLSDMAGNVAEWVMDQVLPPIHGGIQKEDAPIDYLRYLNSNHQPKIDWRIDSSTFVNYVLAVWQQNGIDTTVGSVSRTEQIDPAIRLCWHDVRLSKEELDAKKNGSFRYIAKGGGWIHEPKYLACGSRMAINEGDTHSWLGFRVVMKTTVSLEKVKKWLKK